MFEQFARGAAAGTYDLTAFNERIKKLQQDLLLKNEERFFNIDIFSN